MPIEIEIQHGIAVLRLNRSIINAIDLPLVRELATHLRTVRDDPDIQAAVLCSANDKFFSIGFDIPQLYKLSREDFEVFYTSYNQLCLDLYTLPKPTLAALSGHAIAGGCILALCCDYRLIAGGRKLMGINEILLGVPVPYPGDCILRQLVGTRQARDLAETGKFLESEQLYGIGMVDEVWPLDKVLPEAIERAQELGAQPRDAFAMIKRNRVERIEERIAKLLEHKERYFIDCWYSSDTRVRLREAMQKFQDKEAPRD